MNMRGLPPQRQMRDSCVTTVADDAWSCDRHSVRGSARINRTVAPDRPNPKEGKVRFIDVTALTWAYTTAPIVVARRPTTTGARPSQMCNFHGARFRFARFTIRGASDAQIDRARGVGPRRGLDHFPTY
ncbi:hypothetical protein Aab01nite_22520 [Paractinoplanes abujensis]|nr:hypothetical protein Aab01nite_22520 [Actinoplanes abujensis]